jgi:RND family efflux transporter MFP subunit
MNFRSTVRISSATWVLAICLSLAGCGHRPSATPVTSPTLVTVSYPVERSVTEYVDFTARTQAVKSVEIRARVWGFLEKVNFKEGALVQKGDVLFEIDPRTYRAAVDQATAKVALDEAQLRYKDAAHHRNEKLRKSGSVSADDFDRSLTERDSAEATLGADKADTEQRRLDLDFTQVRAPISGRVSRALVTEGNLVQSGQTGGTLLTTIVSVDPVYAYFDVDEHTVLRVQKLIREGKATSAREADVPALLGLGNEEGLRHQGMINFVDNQVNPKTGTLRVRGVFPNKDESLTPGLFARIRVPVGQPHPALLVSDRALDNDQGQKILYVVNDKNEVVSRPIRVGALHDGLRVIEDGLQPGEPVIVNGLQLVRPGMTVEPNLVDMPTAGGGGQDSRVTSQNGPFAKITP